MSLLVNGYGTMMQMLRLLTALAAIVLMFQHARVCAQDRISGIVNDYTRVITVETINCLSRLRVDSIATFTKGDRVLLIQVQGCTQPSGYDVSTVGHCEFAVIDSIRGTDIWLRFPLQNTYANCGHIQLVRVPVYARATVTAPLTGRPWDGRVGGIVVIDVSGALTLSANINADSIGFRGGVTWQGGGACSTLLDDDVMLSPNSAAKGETIVRPLPSQVSGGRALFGAGGGGRGHNSGGGGGGNGGIGGKGGSQWEGCGAFFDNGGRPGVRAAPVFNGLPLPQLGSGGGAGQMNNNNGTPGGRGGGIVIIRCDTIIGNQNSISANGAPPTRVGINDGAGGGGAGGSVVLQCRVAIGPVAVSAVGAPGGNLNVGSLHGPGGGAGGGMFIFSQAIPPPSLTYTVAGGLYGRNIAFGDIRNSVYLAESGEPGAVAYRAPVPENVTPPPPIDVRAGPGYTVCAGDSITLDCVITGRADTIIWKNSRGTIIGRSSRAGTRAAVTDTFVVRVIGPTGCWAEDSIIVGVRAPWVLRMDSVSLGILRCADPIDTSIVIRNLSNRRASFKQWSSTGSGTVTTINPPDTLAARDSIRVRLRIVPGDRTGFQRARIEVVASPCDSLIVGFISWIREDRNLRLSPDTVRMDTLSSCSVISVDTLIDVRIIGADVTLEGVIADSNVEAVGLAPLRWNNGVAQPIRLRWSPNRTRTDGRLGLVVRDSACLDTLWMHVGGIFSAPFIIAPDSLTAPQILLCEDSIEVIQIPIQSDSATVWVIDSVNLTGPGTTTVMRGDTLRGLDTITVRARPTAGGSYSIVLRMRLAPCDTVVTIHIQGVAQDASITHTRVLQYTEPIIGRREILRSSYVNTGTIPYTVDLVHAPSSPYTVRQITPPLPAILAPRDSVTIDVEYRQTFGLHVDSIVLRRIDVCPADFQTQARGEGFAITRVRIPDIAVKTGSMTSIPIILDGRPDIDSSLLDTFRLQYAWKSTEAFVEAGFNQRARWRVATRNDSTVVDVLGRWDGTDTLATIPVRALLSVLPSTGLIFDRAPGFSWIGQASETAYDDGSLVMDDVCAGRSLRSIATDDASIPRVAPQPVDDIMYVYVPRASAGAIRVQIIDLVGRSVAMSSIAAGRAVDQGAVAIDVSMIPSGLYVVRITAENGTVDVLTAVR